MKKVDKTNLEQQNKVNIIRIKKNIKACDIFSL